MVMLKLNVYTKFYRVHARLPTENYLRYVTNLLGISWVFPGISLFNILRCFVYFLK